MISSPEKYNPGIFSSISLELYPDGSNFSKTVLFLIVISIIILGFLFWNMLKSKAQVLRQRNFFEKILNSTDNIIDYYQPIRNDKKEIIDFRIVFSNSKIKEINGMSPQDINGRLLSEIYPATFENGFFEMIKECIENNKVVNFETQYDVQGKLRIFLTTAIKAGNGATITSVEVTALRSTTKKLEDVNRELAIKNSELNKAETIARGGSFRIDLETGVAEFSENFYRVLDIASGMRVSFSAFKALVHPDDREIFEEFLTELIESRDEKKQIFRFINNDLKVLSVLATGRFIIENGRDFLVGVIQDITQEIEQKAFLEKQNLELKRSNEELDSFTRVVSHDLQEPLRKIQMFISLIEEDKEMSSETRFYFERTKKAAGHMQTLIRDLLSYFRIENNDGNFISVDLNRIIERVIEGHQELIHEIGAKITVNEMPTVKGIKFQMEQLFDNIISNSLKYRRIQVPLEVIISSEKVKREQVEENFPKKKFSYYYKISILDNGSGFDQELAGKIFDLFQRLHQSKEYSGTGLGLAICKKITENHDGFISAFGEENKGACFLIYIPLV